MPSPFPGMDPYLEDPTWWPGFHQGYITYLTEALNALLPPRYVASMQVRLYLVEPGSDIYPDAHIRERPAPARPRDHGAVAEIAEDPPLVLELEKVEETYINIIPSHTDGERVVTTIELLSPKNKTPGPGRRAYRRKQRRVLGGDSHLLEIDLLRGGRPAVVAPRDLIVTHRPYHYLVSLSRADQRDHCEAWPFTIRDRLPRIRIPLAGDDPDVITDLQAVLDRCYDAAAFGRQLDYRRDPPGRLDRADFDWLDALLRERGLRASA